MIRCSLCSSPTTLEELRETAWLEPQVIERLASWSPEWRQPDGACPACVQHALLEVLQERGEDALHAAIQRVWPLNAEDAYGPLPTPLRMHADPHYTGRGITLAMVDSGFYPHPDLTRPSNRVRAWVDASMPSIPDVHWDRPGPEQWHGLMTSTVAAGSGSLSHGLYRGIASDADLVLVQVRDEAGRITNDSICRALAWIYANAERLRIRVVNLSVCGDPEGSSRIDDAVAKLVETNVVVVAAAGNDGVRILVPPAASPEAITVGGLDDRNTFDHSVTGLWHSNYGDGKPEVVAPSLWVVAPLLPGTEESARAQILFERRRNGDATAEPEILGRKLVRPEYQLVEGTSFAAPIVSSILCAMLEANPSLTPQEVRVLLTLAAQPIPGASRERQGAGAIDAGHAVALAAEGCGAAQFVCRTTAAADVTIAGGWNNWTLPGIPAKQIRPGLWAAPHPSLARGSYGYKFLVDENIWRADESNPLKAADGFGGWNSILRIPE